MMIVRPPPLLQTPHNPAYRHPPHVRRRPDGPNRCSMIATHGNGGKYPPGTERVYREDHGRPDHSGGGRGVVKLPLHVHCRDNFRPYYLNHRRWAHLRRQALERTGGGADGAAQRAVWRWTIWYRSPTAAQPMTSTTSKILAARVTSPRPRLRTGNAVLFHPMSRRDENWLLSSSERVFAVRR